MKHLTTLTRMTLITLFLGAMSYALAQDNARPSASDMSPSSVQQEIQSPLSMLQHEWAHINYEVEEKQKEKEFAALIEKAKFFANR